MAAISAVISEPSGQIVSGAAAFYEEHGWYAAPAIVDEKLLRQARQALKEHWAGHRDYPLAGAGRGFADWMPGDGEGTRNNEYLSLQNERVRALAWQCLMRRRYACTAPLLLSLSCRCQSRRGWRGLRWKQPVILLLIISGRWK